MPTNNNTHFPQGSPSPDIISPNEKTNKTGGNRRN